MKQAITKNRHGVPRIAGTAHQHARSFSAAALQQYEDTKAYRDQSMAWCVATRGWYPAEVVDSWDMIQWPMNQFRSARLTIKGAEVAAAYNTLTRLCTDKKMAVELLGPDYAPHILKTKFILTTEEDNVIPPLAIREMLAAIYTCPDCGREIAIHCAGKPRQCKQCREWRCEKGHKGYDGISGLYSVKTDPPIPMVFGDPRDPNDFKPRSIARAKKTRKVVECNAIPMGCAIIRKDLLKHVSKPWFDTGASYTQDVWFCKKAKKEAGARFAVHTGVEVAHLDTNSGELI